jgi:hypothetical protein
MRVKMENRRGTPFYPDDRVLELMENGRFLDGPSSLHTCLSKLYGGEVVFHGY